jgi:hypothetical protein
VPYDAVEAPVFSASATGWDSRSETLTSLTIPNFQRQHVVDNEGFIEKDRDGAFSDTAFFR